MERPRTVRVTRAVRIPDRVRLTRFRQAPERGVRPLFFSGGTALRGVSRKLVEYTHNSIHLITPFDSGGSSATLRASFDMPAVGDLRNRLMALADRSVLGHPEIYSLFAFRFPQDGKPAALKAWLRRLVEGDDDRIREVPEPLRSLVRNHLGFFQEAMPGDFDLSGANIGNLVLAGGYLNQGRHMDSVLVLFSQLVEVRGTVRPVVDEDLHLVARLASGRTVVGQHRLTGHEFAPLESPVESFFLTRSERRPKPYRPRIPAAVEALIRSADLICYPMGSFYTSVLATLLPDGVAATVAGVDVPKVYVPNPGHDPEEIGLGMADKVRTLLRYLKDGAGGRVPAGALLHYALVDVARSGVLATQVEEIERMG
ncbi:MAG TPA: GAK system CofD-like protein, partial [Longimicrobiales bacterium]|nr:GAK system CofD-like protein [Longimicrobiales bacterium]